MEANNDGPVKHFIRRSLHPQMLSSFSPEYADIPESLLNTTQCYGINNCNKCLDIQNCIWCTDKSECVDSKYIDSVCSHSEQAVTCPESMYTIIFISAVLFLLCVCCVLCYFKKFRRYNNYVQSLLPSRTLTVPRSNRESIFKLGEGEVEWMCIICGFDNHPRSSSCDMCGTDHKFSTDYKQGKKSEKEKRREKKHEKVSKRDITLSADINDQFLDTELPIDAQISQDHIVNLTSGNITPTKGEAGLGLSVNSNASPNKSSGYSIKNLLSPLKRKEASNYRRLNQLSLRQKSARRRKMWQRVIDDSTGMFKWVRCSVADIKVGNAPFGYTPGNSFDNQNSRSNLDDSHTISSISGNNNEYGQRSGSFSVIPGLTEYNPIHRTSTHKKSGSSFHSTERSDSGDSFGDQVLQSHSPGFSSVFNQAGTLEWEKVESGDVSPRSANSSTINSKNLSKKVVLTTSEFLAKQKPGYVKPGSAFSEGPSSSHTYDSSSNISNDQHSRIRHGLDGDAYIPPQIETEHALGIPRSTSMPDVLSPTHRSGLLSSPPSSPPLSGLDGASGFTSNPRNAGTPLGRTLSRDAGHGTLTRSRSLNYNGNLGNHRGNIDFTDPYSGSFDPDSDSITTPLISAYGVYPNSTELRSNEIEERLLCKEDYLESQATEEELRSFYYDLEAIAALTFKDKQLWFLDRMTDIQKPRADGLIRLDVHRSNLLRDSVNTFGNINPVDVHKWLRIQFIGEPGIDAGGLEREWFELVTQALLAPEAGLFIRSSGDGLSGSYHINPCSAMINKDHLKYFKFAGLCFGKAVMNQQAIAATLSLPLRKQMLTMPVTFSDLEFVDANMFQSLIWLKNNKNVDSLSLDFSVCYEYFGHRVEYNLKSNGIDILVNDDNKEEYLSLRLRHRLFDSIKPQLESFLMGFYQVIPPDILSVFDYQELDLLMCGVPEIDVEDWRRHTIYLNEYSRSGPKHKVIKWFWKAVEAFTREERVRLLQFVTGCSRLPAQGFKALQSSDGNFREFNIQSISKRDSKYPRAHTCFNKLDLPLYDSYAELEGYLSIVINMDITGFTME